MSTVFQEHSSNDQFFPACDIILDAKVVVQLEDERAKADMFMNILMRDDEVRASFPGRFTNYNLPPASSFIARSSPYLDA